MSHTQVLSTMRVGGRSHCIIPPNLGLCIEQGVRYEKPLPPDPSERDRLLAWLSADFMDESKWVQLRDLSWEIDLISADGITEEDA
mmetsp:Transcript_75380/g.110462  ORF Transcript_75380/g.110462 Transcript_75380/m.110462 type:complete len:86 (+) Transcript_75380:9-266(+)